MVGLDFSKLGKYSSLILRLGLGAVFLLFGIDQWVHTEFWAGYISPWIHGFLPVPPLEFMKANAVVDFTIGVFLLLGLFTRIISAVAALHLLGVMVAVGYNDVGIRDFGLFAMAVALFFCSSYPFSLDNKIFYKK